MPGNDAFQLMIDAAAAVRILVEAAPAGTAEPTLQAMRYLLQAARCGRIRLRGFRGGKSEHEPIDAAVLSDLEINFLARPSRSDDALGEADLVRLGWGNPSSSDAFPEGGGEPVARNLRFSRAEIEGARTNFASWCKGHEIKPKGRRTGSHEGRLITETARELWGSDRPPQDMRPNQAVGTILDKLQPKGCRPHEDTVKRHLGFKARKRNRPARKGT